MNSRPLRVALIRQRYTPYGGAERFVENTLNTLQEDINIELTLITRKWDNANNPNIQQKICDPFYIGRLWRDWSFSRCACYETYNSNFDLIQSHERIPCGNIYRAGDGVHRAWLEKRSRILPWWKKLFIKISPYHRYLIIQETRLFNNNKLKAIIVNSKIIKQEILKYYPNTSAKIKVIYNSVNKHYFNPTLKNKYYYIIREQLGIAQHNKIILFIGSGFERKGLPLLLRVLPNLIDTHLLVIGKDRKLEQYKRNVRGTSIEGDVHFLGPINDTAPYYGVADLFVFPTLYDPLPNTVLEAMSCGLPVVISSSCGAIDLINDGVEGYICDALDEKSWINAIKHIMQPELRNRMGYNAHNTVQKLNSSNMTNQLITLYKQIISQDYT